MPVSSRDPSAEDHSPFKALLAAWSLVVVVLAAGGFSSRWNYYYNFGLQNLVFQVPLTSLPVHAIEIVRNPENLIDLLKWVVFLLVPFEILHFALVWAANAARERWEDHIAWQSESSFGRAVSRLFKPGSPLLVDAIRAGLIVYIAFYVGGLAGTRDYRANVVEPTSRLPKWPRLWLPVPPMAGLGCRSSAIRGRCWSVGRASVLPLSAIRVLSGS
jgi:hypothetical protein